MLPVTIRTRGLTKVRKVSVVSCRACYEISGAVKQYFAFTMFDEKVRIQV